MQDTHWPALDEVRGTDAISSDDVAAAGGLCHLDGFALLAVSGDDAVPFLQGQLTGDVAALAGGEVQFTAYCNPKGRTLATLLAWQRDATVHLLLPADLADTIARRLGMFVMRAKAEVRRVDDAWHGLGLWGSAAASAVAGIVGDAPAAPFTALHGTAASALALPGAEPRYALFVNAAAAPDPTPLDDPALPWTGTTAWRLQDIRGRLAWVRGATGEAFIPQMLDLDRIGHGISFTKGCFVGQEVIARLHHLGEVKRRLRSGTVACVDAPPPGTALVAAAGRGGQGGGTIVDAVALGNGHSAFLAVVENAAAGGTLRLDSPDGAEVTLDTNPDPAA